MNKTDLLDTLRFERHILSLKLIKLRAFLKKNTRNTDLSVIFIMSCQRQNRVMMEYLATLETQIEILGQELTNDAV